MFSKNSHAQTFNLLLLLLRLPIVKLIAKQHQHGKLDMDKAKSLSDHNYCRRLIAAVLWVGMFVFTAHACTHMVGAGDTWVAMACGRHFVNHGVDTVEPFSANSHSPGPTEEQLAKFPEKFHGIIKKWYPTGWINQNWLGAFIGAGVAAATGWQCS